MAMVFDEALAAELTSDDDERVRLIHHPVPFRVDVPSTRAAAAEYLRVVADRFAIPVEQLERLHEAVSYDDPYEREIEYHLADAKTLSDSTTYVYYQTIHNTPVWDGGLTVTVKEGPPRVVGADHRGHHDLALDLPDPAVVARVRDTLFRQRQELAPLDDGARDDGVTYGRRLSATHVREREAGDDWLDDAVVTRAAFFVYRYDDAQRQPQRDDVTFRLPLPPLPESIREGQHYLVVEIVFLLPGGPGPAGMPWKALVEVETGAVLWLRALTSSVDGLVFRYDPKTKTGNLAHTADDPSSSLNPLRDDVTLTNLDGPVGGTQSLTGTHVTVVERDAPTVAPPTRPSGSDFDYHARTNDFAAVSAYYHANELFETLESILGSGFAAYFGGTSFPVNVDHRASLETEDGIEVNAFCFPDLGGDGIGLVGFCLGDTTNTTEPLGRAVDKWVHWHEVGGHGVLYDHVSFSNFGFAHSAGDALAAFQNDPESALRALPERFQYAPFRPWPPGSGRFFNRGVVDGWAWGGTNDFGGYSYESEQILATTLFRIYRAIGGDAESVSKRWHASRVATWLVLNAIGKLAPSANANTPLQFHDKLLLADADDFAADGLNGGAYRKVIRWAFEKQGLFQPPGAPTPAITAGAPPAVDLYIDDGRGGEYQYQPVHWDNASIWNRTLPDGIFGDLPAVAGLPSNAYVRVKNRGTTAAAGTVKLYHCNPGAGLVWPTDFVQAGPAAGLPTGTVPTDGTYVTVGPFTWTPNVNAYGHDCLLAIVETPQDPSNVASFSPADTIQEWRLVPHDNNIGQQNVQLVPGGGGGEALVESLHGAFFVAGNNLLATADMEVRITLPAVLLRRGWAVSAVEGERFTLKPGEKRRVELAVRAGEDFTTKDVRESDDRRVAVELYANDMLLGGMTYAIDPELERRPLKGAHDDAGKEDPGGCRTAAEKLLDCLDLDTLRVRRVRVRRITLDVELDDDCD